MYRFGFVLLCCILVACGSKKKETKEENGFSYQDFSALFPAASVPFSLADTGLLHNKDTTVIRSSAFAQYIPDSIKNKLFSRGTKIKYVALGKFKVPDGENYYLVKASSGDKKTALLISFKKDGTYGAALPFLVPDEDATTTQNSSIDKSYTISRNIVRKKEGAVVGEGKDVYVYNNEGSQFILIMTDLLDESKAELINPIDTLRRTRKFAGDYGQGKRNLISIRDGRTPNQAIAFVHLEKDNGECIGELKGEILFTSSKTAIYRQGGDPCVLQFEFTPTSVSLKEEQGCGNHRGLNCPMEGTFSRKKEPKTKPSAKKTTKK